LTCDFRITADNAKFVQAFVHIGLVPDAGGIYLLNQLVGPAKTTELVMLGDKINAQDMADLNLVNQVVSSENLDETVVKLAARLSALPGKALSSMKHMINNNAYKGLNKALDMEVQQQTSLAKTDDFIEGVTAFIEKRKPVYQGK
ncbi:enoyl-CoA hydratase/isomerase family protein, partial [Psychrobacter sp.]|uniref:enoyl-CoA hydratase/isomerase family protein n=1 Tax=Psychrobacter sp. TaxID=56811 RepID=UPI003F97A49D